MPLSERGSDELPAGRGQRLPSRRSSELGKRERRKRRMDDADEDDLNSLDEPLEGKKKRRGGSCRASLFSCHVTEQDSGHADEDDLNSLNELLEGKKKRRGGARHSCHAHST